MGAAIARRAMHRLAYPRDDIDAVAHLVANHMRPYGYAASRDPWSDAAVRRFIRDTYLARGDRELANVDMLLRLARADITGSAPRRRRIAEESWRSLKSRVDEVRAEDAVEKLESPLTATTSWSSSAGGLGVGSRPSKTTCRTRWSKDASAKTTRTEPAGSPKPTPASTTSSRSRRWRNRTLS